MNLLTQSEVAALLRCSVSKVERLRRDGDLPYPPGRPVMIELADMLEHLERSKVWIKAPRAPSKAAASVAAAAARGHRAARLAALRCGA